MRWCLCEHCIEAIRSHGERVLTRPMENEDCTTIELEMDKVECDFCEEWYTPNEMFICKED